MHTAATAAFNLALNQLAPNQVLDKRILDAVAATPREAFVPARLAPSAYVDDDLPLGHGRFLLEPVAFARLVQMAELTEKDRVLDIACGYGYSTAVLAKLAGHVTACENVGEFVENISARLQTLNIANASVKQVTNLSAGAPESGPYGIIFINGGIEHTPTSLAAQLAEGGRLLAVHYDTAPLALSHGVGRLTCWRKLNGELFPQEGPDASVPLLADFRKPQSFRL